MSNIVAGFAERAVRTARHDAGSRRVALRFADTRCCRSDDPARFSSANFSRDLPSVGAADYRAAPTKRCKN
jgi:hypothetical protein